ncbi:hypothetical protein LTR10_006593 [Elasticomyces elasticus]|nr:hypothetical protein LTR10_006593 [Elasticomyces elasticus]KAK4973004.1 hypothetical protein LTR42_006298 [Elasticomyces elasticus]
MSLVETIRGLTNRSMLTRNRPTTPMSSVCIRRTDGLLRPTLTSKGTAFWYFLRGSMRIISPVTVAEWFRPPAQAHLVKMGAEPNGTSTVRVDIEMLRRLIVEADLELYNIRTDAWGLITIAMMLLALADAVPLPASMVGSSLSDPAPSTYKKPYARAAVLITLFHHITTGIGAYQHWKLETHHTIAMDIGVYGNVALTALGVAALMFGLKDGEKKHVEKKRL